LANDTLKVFYAPEDLDEKVILSIIKKQGFEAAVVKELSGTQEESMRVQISALPDSIKKHFSMAKDQGKLVLLDFTGPG
jgi:hypothetical protein